ncbi:MAG: hypothetical protein RLZZ461_1901, partial [Planctomycetota bacterium]
GSDPSWLVTQGYNSAPVCLFFDGHVSVKGVREAMDGDARNRTLFENNNVCQNECPGGNCESGLWNRAMASSFGNAGGYGAAYAYDTIVSSGFNFYTTDGIRGKDFPNSSN